MTNYRSYVAVLGLLLGWGAACQARAQVAGSPTPVPLPTGPLVNKRAPELARWTIDYKYRDAGIAKPFAEDATDPIEAFRYE